MNKLVATLFLSLLMPWRSLANPVDTTIRGVFVSFSYSTAIFPADWKGGGINGRGEQMSAAEIGRVKAIAVKALQKYAGSLLKYNLKTIYFLKKMYFYDVSFGGTNSADAVYVANNGIDDGYTDIFIEQTIHHEFSSILMRNYPFLLDTLAWKNANVTGFEYNDPEAGVGAIRNNQSSQELDTVLCKKGFLTEYAVSDIENDLNTLAQNIFRHSAGFWTIVDSYPRIREKISLLISFYHALNPLFTEHYFRKSETQ